MGEIERWHLDVDGTRHVVEIEQKALTRTAVWVRDGVEVGRKRTSDEKFVVAPTGADGAVRLVFGFVGPARRVTLHASETEAHTGLGGRDLQPEAGSRAAARQEWIGRHPRLHLLRQGLGAAGGVLVPIALIWLLARIPLPDLPSIPWPDIDLPSIPWPDLPSIPFPDIDLPSIPFPDLPDLPGWVDPLLKVGVPVAIALVVARGEVKRRRAAEARAAEDAARRTASGTVADEKRAAEQAGEAGAAPDVSARRKPPTTR